MKSLSKFGVLQTIAYSNLKMAQTKVFVLDNGASTFKYGWAGDDQSLQVGGNFIAKSKVEKKKFIGDLEFARDKSALTFTRPFDRGYLVNWDLEKEIWDSVFMGNIAPVETTLLLTEPLLNPDSLSKIQYEVLFEDYAFNSVCCTSAPVLSMYNRMNQEENIKSPCCLVVDTGYSFTHAVPFFDYQKINYGIKRCNIGGKVLTNYLKEVVSYRHWNMMEENYLMNLIKERLCYVSLSFLKELEITNLRGTRNTIKRDYVLPDYIENHTGYIKPRIDLGEKPIQMEIDTTLEQSSGTEKKEPPKVQEQILTMNNERITVPELLFHPSDIGINQAGVAEIIHQSISACHPDLRGLLYSNIIITGGNSLFKNYRDRLYEEVRKLAPAEYDVNITLPEDPISYAWHGGSKMAQRSDFKKYTVSKKDYEENGWIFCKRTFHN